MQSSNLQPPHSGGFYFFMGRIMNKIWDEIEQIRMAKKLTVCDMCNIFGVTEDEYIQMYRRRTRLTNYQLFMFISTTKHPLKSI